MRQNSLRTEVRALYLPRYSLRAAWLPVTTLWLALAYSPVHASVDGSFELARADDFLELSLEALMNIEVVSVSKRSELLQNSAAAVFVLSGESIIRSGVKSIPEALRLVPGLQVARLDSHTWAVSSRGFNSTLADKLEVLMDGRSVYTPLFSGVFWNAQNTLMEDIERIEVIRGPGAALWGANAVNGVVNIVTKKASETQGGFEQVGGGGEFEGFATWRYGGKLADVGHYRFYAKTTHYNDQEKSGSGGGNDRWQHDQAGFRTDMRLGDSTKLTLQGDFYKEEINNTVNAAKDEANSGHNLLARWNYHYTDQSDTELQFYYDKTSIDNRFNFTEDRDTYNIEVKHRFELFDIHEFVVGAGYQITSDNIVNYLPASVAFYPDNRSDETWDFFIQDQISLIPDRLKLTLGAKFERNDYTGDEIQPSVRLGFILDERNTVWGAVSQAVRIPNRLDHDVTFFSGALVGDDGFKSERVIAYEFGYRSILSDSVSFDLALFYNKYTDLRGLSDNMAAPQRLPVLIVNAGDGQSQGGELVVNWNVTPTLKILASYQYLDLDIGPRAGSRDTSIADADESDPNSQYSITADWDMAENWSMQSTVRRVGSLDDQNVDAYTDLNLNLNWQATKDIDLSLVGSNLLDPQHPEFSGGVEIVRSVHGQITWHF